MFDWFAISKFDLGHDYRLRHQSTIEYSPVYVENTVLGGQLFFYLFVCLFLACLNPGSQAHPHALGSELDNSDLSISTGPVYWSSQLRVNLVPSERLTGFLGPVFSSRAGLNQLFSSLGKITGKSDPCHSYLKLNMFVFEWTFCNAFSTIGTGRRGVISHALLCKPYILTYMNDAPIREGYRKTITSHRRRASSFRAPTMLLFCGTHHVSQYIANSSASSCTVRSAYARESDWLNSSAPCACGRHVALVNWVSRTWSQDGPEWNVQMKQEWGIICQIKVMNFKGETISGLASWSAH